MKVKYYIVLLLILIVQAYAQERKFCRFEKEGKISYGEVINDQINELSAAPWSHPNPTGVGFNLSEVRLLSPSEPKVIIGLSKSYKNAWTNKSPPKTVRWFIKPPTSEASPNDSIILPASIDEVKVECELVIVIGKSVKDADELEAAKAIFGYTLGNDIVGNKESYLLVNQEPPESAGDLLAPGLKIGDKFAPFGPYIHSGVEWKNRNWELVVKNPVNGKNIHHLGNTGDLIYNPSKIVSDLSRILTLNPGDIIYTGTSKSIVAAKGDIVTIEMEGIGSLSNKIIKNDKAK